MEVLSGKALVVYFLTIAVVFGEAEKNSTSAESNILKRYQLECIEATRVDADLVMNLKAGIGWQSKLQPLKEWALCVLKKLGLMTNEGVYKLDVAWSKVPHNADKIEVERVIDTCLTPKHILPEEIAWRYIKCIHFNDPQSKLYFLTVV